MKINKLLNSLLSFRVKDIQGKINIGNPFRV